MTNTHDSVRIGGWVERFRRMRLVLAVAALAFAGLWMFGAIAALPALAGFALIAAAALIASASGGGDAGSLGNARAARAPHRGSADRIGAGRACRIRWLRSIGAATSSRSMRGRPRWRRRCVRGEPVSLGLRVPEVLEAIRRARASGIAQRVEFSERVPLDRWYEVIVTPISSPGAGRDPGLVLLAFHDLTPLRRVEEMRADFVANASHELRTPLAALSGFIDTLQRLGARRSGGARALPRRSCRRRPTAWPG